MPNLSQAGLRSWSAIRVQIVVQFALRRLEAAGCPRKQASGVRGFSRRLNAVHPLWRFLRCVREKIRQGVIALSARIHSRAGCGTWNQRRTLGWREIFKPAMSSVAFTTDMTLPSYTQQVRRLLAN
jgi:hypothetical protein